jgi:hypothetical protein
MADIGNPEIVFNTVTFDEDDCVQNSQLSLTAVVSTYMCDGFMKVVTGPTSGVLTATIAIAADDTAKMTALTTGATSTLSYWPAGNTATHIAVTSTNATVTAISSPADVASFLSYDVTFHLDNVTIAAQGA